MKLQHESSNPRSARSRLAVIVAVMALMVAACSSATAPSSAPVAPAGSVAPSGSAAPSGNAAAGTTPDRATISLPDKAHILDTKAFGLAPVDQLIVLFADGKGPADADALALRLGGRVVGQVDAVNAFQVETSGTTEADLAAALKTARATPGVALAAPNQAMRMDAEPGEIWGKRISPLTNPIYGDGNGDGYGLIGVSTAWDYIRGSGMDLVPVQVGVVDSGLWTGSNEFDKGAVIRFTEEDARRARPEKETNADGSQSDDPSGGHGSGVNALIGADSENGGPAGVASVLGDRLTISNTNLWSGDYGTEWTPAPADPEDPTIVNIPGDGTYQFSGLVAIMNQIKSGSTIINMSWGPKDPAKTDPDVPKLYRAFFERMSRERPDLIFVAAAGNDGHPADGAQQYPGGFNLPNVITVGNVTNDGKIWKSSNTAGRDFEVSLFAPGHQAVRGQDPDTKEIKNLYGGTSMASPQVAATAALLRSLNGNLTAAEIKGLLTSTATDRDGVMVLSVDEAVKAVIDRNCDEAGIPRMDRETLLGRGAVDAVAVPVAGTPGEYTVRGIVKAAGVKGVDLEVAVFDGEVTGGEEPAHLEQAGEAAWTVKLDRPDEGIITVHRADNQAGSRIAIETIDVNGDWAGSFTFTSIDMDESVKEQAKEQGCDAAMIQDLLGKALPMTLELNVDPDSTGTSTYWLDVSSLKGADGKPAKSDPQTAPVTYKGVELTFKLDQSGGATKMTGIVSRSGSGLTIDGSVTIAGKGYSARAAWTVARGG